MQLLYYIIAVRSQLAVANTFRVALVSEYSGSLQGNAEKFIEGFQDFSVPVINSWGGIPIANVPYKVEVVGYDTQSDESRVPEVIKAVAQGVDMDGNAVGDVHAIVAGTSKMNKAIFGPAEAAGLVNIHTSGGNPAMWLETNTYAYGLHLPFIWYTRGPMKMAAARGAKTIGIIRSLAHGFSKLSCIAALQWAADAKLTVVGPTLDWCTAQGGKVGCKVVGQRCVCGDQSDVDMFGLGYNIEETTNFYQIDENRLGNKLQFGIVDKNTTEFAQTIFQDMISQGPMPDILLNFAPEWHNVLKAMVLEDITPKILLGWQGGVTTNWAVPSEDNEGLVELTPVHGYWAMGFGQWHSAMSFNDPVFKTNANASKLFEKMQGRALDYDTAGAIAAGVVLYTAMSKHFNQDFSTLSLIEKRDAVKKAVGDMNDETMWGTLRFNSNHQNIGRGTAAWQILPDENKTFQQLCVLPVENAEADMFMPFPTWASRAGCAPGNYNSGSACELCDQGRFNNETTLGLTSTTCSVCSAGYGTDVEGRSECQECAAGRSQDGDRDVGICRECIEGEFQDKVRATACTSCQIGTFAATKGHANCSACSAGTFQSSLGQSECLSCSNGTFAKDPGQSKCTMCPSGRFAPRAQMISCDMCPDGFTTEAIASEDSSQCVCPEGKYQAGASCVECKEGMMCPIASNAANFGAEGPVPALKPGYWSDPSNPLSVFQCEDDVKCPGGQPGTCHSELTKRACAICADDYSWNGETCLKCTSVETSKFLYPVLPCSLMPIVITTMYVIFKDRIHQWGSYGNGVATVGFLVLTHYQVIDMLGIVATIPGTPDIMQGSLRLWQWTNNLAKILAPECAGFGGMQAALIGQTLLPVLLLIITIITWLASQLLAKLANNATFAMDPNRLFNVFMSLVFTFFNAIVALSLMLFKCLDNPNGETTLAADYSIICGDDEWNDMVVIAVFATLVYVVGFAALLLRVILVSRSYIEDEGFQMRWKFLFIKFRLDVWWWAMTYLAKGLFYNLGFVIFLHSLQQLYWIMALTTVYICCVVTFLPYRHRATVLVDGMVCVSIIYVCVFKTWFAPRLNGDMDDAMAGVLVFTTFTPLAVAGAVGSYFIYMRFFGHVHETQKIRMQCTRFSASILALTALDQSTLHKICQDVGEWDRWYIHHMVSLINGERNLGIVGHSRKVSTGIGSGSLGLPK